MSLDGKTVLITRRHEQSAGLCEVLRQRGARVEVVPAIEIAPPRTWAACDEALGHLERYAAVLLTSSNGARAFLGRACERGISISGVRIEVIGEATRRAVADAGADPARGPDHRNAVEFAQRLLASPVRGKAFLFPCGDLAREELPDILREQGARVDQVEVYRTVAPDPEAMAPARALLAESEGVVVIFGSPSAVRNLRDFLGAESSALLDRAVIAAAGRTTADEVLRCGWTPGIVAPSPTARSLVDAIDQYFA